MRRYHYQYILMYVKKLVEKALRIATQDTFMSTEQTNNVTPILYNLSIYEDRTRPFNLKNATPY